MRRGGRGIKKKWLLNGIFLVLVLGLTIWFTFRGEDLSRIWGYLRTASPWWCGIAVALVVAFILSESVIIWILLRSIKQPARLTHCFLYSFTGFFFSCITPSASGGQPMQAMLMRRDRIPVSASVPLLLLVTILYKMVLVVIGGVVLIARPSFVMPYLDPVITWFRLGIWLNVAFIALVLLAVFRPEWMRRPVRGLLRLVYRLLKKDPEVGAARGDAWVDGYRDVAATFRRDWRGLGIAALITFLQRILLFAVTWCACRAFDIPGTGFILTVTLQGMISVAADMMPLPGGSGISEALFLAIFTPLCGERTLPVMVVSRGIGFYVQMLIGALFTVVAMFVIREKKPVSDGIPQKKEESI